MAGFGGDMGENITNGIDIKQWSLSIQDGKRLEFSVWDFAGQTVYYNTHQVLHNGYHLTWVRSVTVLML